MGDPDPRTAVVIATRNRAALLQETLVRLLALPERPRVVVVDNASADHTREVARAAGPGVDLVALRENAAAAARNVGVAAVTTPYVAFADDDSWYAPGSLARAADLFDTHPRLGLIAARVLVGPTGRLDPTCAVMAGSRLPTASDVPGTAVLGFLACGAVVRRSAFLAAGGFSPRFGIGGEESLLAVDLAAAGWDLAYVDAVTAFHCPPPRPDHGSRRRAQVRNALWCAWLRRRPLGAVARTARLVVQHLLDPPGRAGVLDALRGAGSVLRDRRPVSRALDQRLRQIE